MHVNDAMRLMWYNIDMISEVQVIISIGLLSAYFFFLLLMRHAVRNHFLITRFTITAFIVYMFATLIVVYWTPMMDNAVQGSVAFLAGLVLGRFMAVTVERRKIAEEGLSNYLEHYLHIHIKSLENLEWWSIVNVHTVIVTLIFIDLLGLNRTVYDSAPATLFIVVLALFLVGTVIPYAVHLWTIKASHFHKKLTHIEK